MAGNIEDSIRFVEKLIENPNTDLDSITIELGDKNDRVERRMNGNQVVFRVPKSYYETLRIKLDGEKAVKKLRVNTEKKERSRFIDEGARDINAIFRGHQRDEAIANIEKYSDIKRPTTEQIAKRKKAKRLAQKRNIKNKPNKSKKINKQKNKTGKRIKALFGAFVVAAGMTAGGIALDHYVGDYNQTAETVKGMSVDQIKELAKREFTEAIRQDTSMSDIKITKTSISSSEERTEMTLSECEEKTTYSISVNNRDPISVGTIGGNITRIYSIIDNSSNEREAINALMKERDFVKKNRFKKGKELTTETRPTETKSEGTQDMDEYTL